MSNEIHDYHSNSLRGLVVALIGNMLVWCGDILNSNGFGAVLKLLGFVSVILAIANTLGILDPVKRKLRSLLGITKGKR